MLAGKNVVVTGCLSGIGKQAMCTFAENHANVFACALEKTDEFEALCAKLSTDNGVKVTPVYFDAMDNDSIKSAAQRILKEKAAIHGLVNIAGINRDALFGMITPQDLQDTFQVNLFSQILFSQYISRIMKKSGETGSIAFVSSVTALDGNEGQTAYAASKAALLGTMHSMARELGPYGIRVNAVAPGVIQTPMTEKLSEALKEEKIQLMSIKRLGRAEEVANVFLFLMSDLSSHVTGQVIRIDGGMR